MWSVWCQKTSSSALRLQQRTPLYAAQRWMSAGSKRKMKVHDILFSKSNKVAPIQTKSKPKPSRKEQNKPEEKNDNMRVFHDPVSGVSMGFAQDLMTDGFFKDLAQGIKYSDESTGPKSIFDDEYDDDSDDGPVSLEFTKDD